MPTLVVEDGTGKPDANTYAAVADCDTYNQGNLYADAWNNAITATKETALIMATRTIDAGVEFNGSRTSITQALCWPRVWAENTEVSDWFAWGLSFGFWIEDQNMEGIWAPYWATNAVPAPIRGATCEMARELIKVDRTQDDLTRGLKSVGIGQGAVSVVFDPTDRKHIFTDLIRAMLQPFGSIRIGRKMTPVYRG